MNILRSFLGGAAWLVGWALLFTVEELVALAPPVALQTATRRNLRLLSTTLTLIGNLLLGPSAWFWVAWSGLALFSTFPLIVNHHDPNDPPRRSQTR